ncbi:MAG: hypothetical protein KGQ70_08015, partial [Alphaproteobacteria bacterium]|nr:hypothetical protein [Alphaproteobacteria bacterium]
DKALALYARALALQPDNPPLLAEMVLLGYKACAWGKTDALEALLLDMVRQKREGIVPFTLLSTDATAEDLLVAAQTFCRAIAPPEKSVFKHSVRPARDKIKIGYLSSDFWAHATAHLMAELFERHDRARFHITAYSYGQNAGDAMRQRLVAAFDDFADVGPLDDRAAAQKIYDDGVDILVDLKGCFTPDARIGIAALRPAPVQVNFLGYPGTTGADFIDYIVADRFIIPEVCEKFYSEKVVCLPHCYQPNDTHRKIAEPVPSRAACGLPEGAFVFSCFNAAYKITPRVFAVWMRLLAQAPNSVLWLYESIPSIKDNLLRAAESHGIDARRIVFAPKAAPAEHLARQKCADLFLDTLPVNAHTTASDALWAGLPVLTCVGETFAGRVAGSLLTAAGLPELITHTRADYEAAALKLAQNPDQLAALREKIEKTRDTVPLFDIARYTANLESAYETMWRTWRNREKPRAFAVAEERTSAP